MWWTIGQDEALGAIQADLAAGASAHAYLLSGPPQTGKATLARELAMALNCLRSAAGEAAAGEPCHECRSCRRIEEGKHADVQLLGIDSVCDDQNEREHDHARRPATVIRLCQVQRVRRVAAEAPFEGRWRVFLVDPAELLNNESANALLKTLEEPPPGVVFLLLTADEQAVPETVHSRCRRLEVRPLPADEVAGYLTAQLGVEPREAAALARLSHGRLGRAITAAREGGLQARRELVQNVVELAAGGRFRRLTAAEELAHQWNQQRSSVRAVLDAWADWWRDVLLAALNRSDLVTHAGLEELAAREAAGYTPGQLVAFLGNLRQVQGYLEENVNPRLALDVLLLSLPTKREGQGAAAGRAV